MLRPGNPACGGSTSRMMADNLHAQLAPLDRYGAAGLALPAAMGLRALVNTFGAALRTGARASLRPAFACRRFASRPASPPAGGGALRRPLLIGSRTPHMGRRKHKCGKSSDVSAMLRSGLCPARRPAAFAQRSLRAAGAAQPLRSCWLQLGAGRWPSRPVRRGAPRARACRLLRALLTRRPIAPPASFTRGGSAAARGQ